MLKTVSYLDHVCISGNQREMRRVLRDLGFVFGNNSKDALTHIVFQRGYFEFTDRDSINKGGAGAGFENIRATERPSMISIWFGASDIYKMKDRFNAQGWETTDIMHMEKRRRAKHGAIKGLAGFTGFVQKGSYPYDNGVATGAMKHLSPELMYDGPMYMQLNDARAMRGVIFVCREEEKKQELYKYYSELYKVFDGCDEKRTDMTENGFVNMQEYKELFRKEYDGPQSVGLGAVVFDGGDMVYLQEQCEEMGISCFNDGLTLYVDATESLGTFLVFNCDLKYDVIGKI